MHRFVVGVDKIFDPEKYNVVLTGTSIVFLEGTSYLVKNLFTSLMLAVLLISIFMAWMFKATILRYGGVRLYRLMVPFFLGLALGEFSTAVLWVFIDGAFGVQGNMIFNF